MVGVTEVLSATKFVMCFNNSRKLIIPLQNSRSLSIVKSFGPLIPGLGNHFALEPV